MKKYQVFVSSTFEDLRGARQAVSGALLRASCFPAGMELFPAADEEQLSFIKNIIAQSDYYLLILAGRYGSIDPKSGLSYTEQEYSFAMSIKKPIIRLVHRDPFGMLSKDLLETSDRGRENLHRFRQLVTTGALVRQWETTEELMFEAVMALEDAKSRNPAVGWVRGDEVKNKNEDSKSKIQALEAEIELLKGASKKPRSEFIDKCVQAFELGTSKNLLESVADATLNKVVFIEDLRNHLTEFGLKPDSAEAVTRALVLDGVVKIRTTGEVIVSGESRDYLEELLFNRLI